MAQTSEMSKRNFSYSSGTDKRAAKRQKSLSPEGDTVIMEKGGDRHERARTPAADLDQRGLFSWGKTMIKRFLPHHKQRKRVEEPSRKSSPPAQMPVPEMKQINHIPTSTTTSSLVLAAPPVLLPQGEPSSRQSPPGTPSSRIDTGGRSSSNTSRQPSGSPTSQHSRRSQYSRRSNDQANSSFAAPGSPLPERSSIDYPTPIPLATASIAANISHASHSSTREAPRVINMEDETTWQPPLNELGTLAMLTCAEAPQVDDIDLKPALGFIETTETVVNASSLHVESTSMSIEVQTDMTQLEQPTAASTLTRSSPSPASRLGSLPNNCIGTSPQDAIEINDEEEDEGEYEDVDDVGEEDMNDRMDQDGMEVLQDGFYESPGAGPSRSRLSNTDHNTGTKAGLFAPASTEGDLFPNGSLSGPPQHQQQQRQQQVQRTYGSSLPLSSPLAPTYSQHRQDTRYGVLEVKRPAIPQRAGRSRDYIWASGGHRSASTGSQASGTSSRHSRGSSHGRSSRTPSRPRVYSKHSAKFEHRARAGRLRGGSGSESGSSNAEARRQLEKSKAVWAKSHPDIAATLERVLERNFPVDKKDPYVVAAPRIRDSNSRRNVFDLESVHRSLEEAVAKPKPAPHKPEKTYKVSQKARETAYQVEQHDIKSIKERYAEEHFKKEARVQKSLQGRAATLSKEQLALIQQVHANPGFKSPTCGNEQVTHRSLQRLKPGTWLDDEVVNYYCALVCKRAADEPEKYGKLHYFNTFFYAKMEKDGYAGARLRRWTKKVDIFEKDAILIPINRGNAHWVAALINFKMGRIEYYDSMVGAFPGKSAQHVAEVLLEYLNDEHKDKKGSPFTMPMAMPPKQIRKTDLFLQRSCKEATSSVPALMIRNGFDFEAAKMPFYRQLMVYEIARGKLEPRR